MKHLALFALCGAIVTLAAAAVAQPNLTGIVQFSTDGAGNDSGGQVWNTLGGDPTWNLYVIAGAPGGSFVNSGDSGSTSISIPLTTGSHAFTLHGDLGSIDPTYVGVNLFFDGDNTNPGISVFGQSGVAGGAADGGSTRTLTAGIVTGAGTLVWSDPIYRVTLANFAFLNAAASGTDRVASHAATPNQNNDELVTFTLQVDRVGPVPSLTPTGLVLLAAALAAAALLLLARRG